MKIRNGFVSNSSSSSFIMLIPENFNIDEYDLSQHQSKLDYNDIDEDTFKNLFKKLQKQGWVGGYDGHNYYPITEVFDNFVIASIETGPDDGSIQLLGKKEVDKIKKLLNIV